MGNHKKLDDRQGHWILAKMGKRVLRPGGKELTTKMIDALKINKEDDVVEFAPGMGFTAEMTLRNNPKSYTGVDLNEEAVSILKKKIKGENRQFVIGNASATNLEDSSYTKVYGEAMLTMQPDHKKSMIVKEAHRILKPGGFYGIHELGLQPNDISEEKKAEIQLELGQAIKVNARPLTVDEWTKILENEGFEVVETNTNPMHLLEPKRVIDDEGFGRTLKIAFNVLTHPTARKRILGMRKVFRKYEDQLNAVSIVARKK